MRRCRSGQARAQSCIGWCSPLFLAPKRARRCHPERRRREGSRTSRSFARARSARSLRMTARGASVGKRVMADCLRAWALSSIISESGRACHPERRRREGSRTSYQPDIKRPLPEDLAERGNYKPGQTIRARMGCSTRRKGSNTRPRISSVTTPSSGSASPGWPRTTGE